MAEEPRENRKMLDAGETSYETALYVGDNGMWTVIEITRRPILKAPSQYLANTIIAKLKGANP